MDRNYKLLITSSLVALMATGCSSFGQRGNTDPQTTVNSGSSSYAAGQQQASSGVVAQAPVATTCGQCAINQAQNTTQNGRTQQWYVDQWNRQQAGKQTPAVANGRTQQWYIDQYNRSQAAAKAKAATTTSNGRSQQWYIDQYNRQQAEAKAKAAAARAKPAPAANGRTKQWYVDQWNRQQAAAAAAKKQPVYTPPKPVVVQQPTYVAPAYVPPKPVVAVKPYVPPAPAPAPVTKTTTTYVDYTNGAASTAVAPSNKSLYTGSFQQPRQAYTQYTPKTYTGGANSSSSTVYNAPAATTTAGGNTYVVKKGDTVFEVMRQTGVYWKEIISMNNLQAPSYTIQPGQRLRLK
ncbi:LysM peptidoglycan-binding domain-containing protein [Leucothrix sargassi]|nr:LysM peptidoglycan-binding domain-containing protein [Leucothrix sargassi]